MAYDQTQVAFVDTETTGLNPEEHFIWEIAVIVDGVEHCWQQWLEPARTVKADPFAAELTKFSDRYYGLDALDPLDSMQKFGGLVKGRHIVGAVPSFDEERIRREWVRLLGYPDRFPWHYHLIDVEALAVGYLASEAGRNAAVGSTTLPWKSHDLSARLGVTSDPATEHTALADARWAKALFERIMGDPQ